MKIRFAILAAIAAVLIVCLPAQGSSISMTCTSPTNGGVYSSPMPVQCTATAVGDKVDGPWHIYVDGGSQDVVVNASVAATSSINPMLSLPTGAHTITIRAWQAAGSLYATAAFSFSIGTTPPNPSPSAIFTASPSSVITGGSSTLSWSTSNSSSVSIDQSIGVVALSGSVSVSPSVTTTYTLIATGAGGTVTKQATVTVAPTPPPPTSGGHVVIVMEENHTYADTVNPNNMPYLYSLSQKYSNATQYYAETHPSIGNYFELTAGQKITDDDSSATIYDVTNIVTYLQSSGKTWKVYAEDLPGVGYTGGNTGAYVKHHNPFAYFANVVNTALKNNIVPFSQFGQDLANGQLPNYSFVIPNQCNNAHDCSLNTADSWLRQNIDPLLNDTKTFGVDGLLMMVMDESDGTDTQLGGGHTAAVLAGPQVKRGVQSQTIYKPSSVLKTVCDVLLLNGCPGRSQSTIGFNDMRN